MAPDSQFKLTYSTMFNPPEELHTQYDAALAAVRAGLGREYGMIIDGKDVFADEKFEDRNPADTREVLGVFQKGTAAHAQQAVAAARRAFETWRLTPWQERVALVRKAAQIMDRRTFEMGAVVGLEVGKSRMEAVGDVAETADLFRYACDRMEAADGFVTEMGQDPLPGFISTNTSYLRPYGVWVVISPFNFPSALSGGPTAAALVAGNTVVLKPATDTPWTARLIAECLREAGLPDGVYNFVSGPGSTLGQALIDSPDVAGITFTGSYDVGMKINRDFAHGRWVRPTILEMGGKNPAIVSRHGNLEDAALGIVRSAFGLQGQKCSACSRAFIEEPVYDEVVERMIALTGKLSIGDPTARGIYNGPVINKSSYADYQRFSAELHQAGRVVAGGKVLTEGEFAHGYFCTNTLVVDLPFENHLWQDEMFVPILTIAKVKNLDEALRLANDVAYGLTSGFYGTQEEVEWFFDHIQSGLAYANRPQGATTGAWPGFQPFGGWKGSGSSGKNSGGVHYLQLYMHEQINTRVRRA